MCFEPNTSSTFGETKDENPRRKKYGKMRSARWQWRSREKRMEIETKKNLFGIQVDRIVHVCAVSALFKVSGDDNGCRAIAFTSISVIFIENEINGGVHCQCDRSHVNCTSNNIHSTVKPPSKCRSAMQFDAEQFGKFQRLFYYFLDAVEFSFFSQSVSQLTHFLILQNRWDSYEFVYLFVVVVVFDFFFRLSEFDIFPCALFFSFWY